MLFIALCCAVSGAMSDHAAIQRQMQTVIDEMDASKYVAPAEQIVLNYQWAQGRPPTAEEFHTLIGLREQLNLKNSDLLGFALRGDQRATTWEMCERFLARKSARPAPSAQSKALAEDLAQTVLAPSVQEEACSVAPLPPAPAEPGVAYHVYFGFLHAHSELSDGEGSPDQAYADARAAGLDFFALTDHAEQLQVWPWQNKWQLEKDAALRADDPGAFAALWGFEWSSPLYGHVNVINSQDYTHCLADARLANLYEWLQLRPEAFGRFNHPGYFNYSLMDLMHFRLAPCAVNQMTGVELWNEDESFDRYYYSGNWEGQESYLDKANLQGWRLGALGGEDNHHADWGTMTQFRTAVLATELTRDAIAEAYMMRRFYATEDENLMLDFRSQGYPMGSVLDDEPRVFNLVGFDRDGEAFCEARLYRNGELIDTRPLSGPFLSITFADDFAGPAYYYAIVQQADDSDANGRNDEAITSPIWFGEVQQQKHTGCFRPGKTAQPASANLSDLLVLALALGVLAARRR